MWARFTLQCFFILIVVRCILAIGSNVVQFFSWCAKCALHAYEPNTIGGMPPQEFETLDVPKMLLRLAFFPGVPGNERLL